MSVLRNFNDSDNWKKMVLKEYDGMICVLNHMLNLTQQKQSFSEITLFCLQQSAIIETNNKYKTPGFILCMRSGEH
jgi:hypothetical protein